MVELLLILGIFTFHAVYPVIEALPLDYVVGYSACYSVPVQGIESYSCRVRCDTHSE